MRTRQIGITTKEECAMSDKVRLALIGAGSMANGVHYPSLKEMDDVEMAGLCDLVEDKLNATADKFEIEKRFSDYRQMIEEVDPDAVYVLMPPHHLFDICVHCLEQGLHVFIEKPPALTAYQIRSLAQLADKNNCLTMTGFNRRFIPLLRQCRQRVFDRGGMTQCVSTFYKWHTAGPYYNGVVDILYCDAIHAVDTLRWMGGDVAEVASDIKFNGREFETSWIVLTRHDSGCTGVLLTNWSVGGRVHTFEMHGIGISVFAEPEIDGEATILVDGGDPEVITTIEATGNEERHHTYGFFGENRHFVDCIQANDEPETCFADATKTMELADRIYGNQV